MLFYSWYNDDYPVEVQACQGIALNYYYAGNMHKARQYHERAIRGKAENQTSVVYQTAISILATNAKAAQNTYFRKLSAGLKRVPSPSGYCSSEANAQINLLPFFTEAQAFYMDQQNGSKQCKIKFKNLKLQQKQQQAVKPQTFYQPRLKSIGLFTADQFSKIVSRAKSRTQEQVAEVAHLHHLSITRVAPLSLQRSRLTQRLAALTAAMEI